MSTPFLCLYSRAVALAPEGGGVYMGKAASLPGREFRCTGAERNRCRSE
jgi:hypothetical protein